jgi:hypothetical protein
MGVKLFITLALTAIANHALVLAVLAGLRRQQPSYASSPPSNSARTVQERGQHAVRCLALVNAFSMLALPYTITDAGPLQQSGARVVCFFYACKTLDLGLSRVSRPPTRLVFGRAKDGAVSQTAAPLASTEDHLAYLLLLMTEMRYRSFDIAVEQKHRSEMVSTASDQLRWTLVLLMLLPIAAYLIPLAELKCAALLLLIQYGLEGLHRALHWHCPNQLFYRPFSAATLSDFWSTRWHASASPWLQSLAYKPTQLLTGSRAAGVLATFCLSGMWHGWASAPLVTRPGLLGLEVWALFMAFGFGCLAERWIWTKKQGGNAQRICVWLYALTGAGVCWRTLERYAKIDWMRTR